MLLTFFRKYSIIITQKERGNKPMSKCVDSNCGYYWHEVGELYPRCHYNDPWPAPCEYDDEPEEVEDRYTYDDLGYNWF